MQYPHTIVITKTPEYVQNETTGNFETEEEGTLFTSECRAEVREYSPVLKGDDGEEIVYKWIVYMPKTTEVFTFGDKVVVTIDGTDFESSLKRQHNGQFNTRIWV